VIEKEIGLSYLIVVWNLKDNKEVSNFSSERIRQYFYGKGSKAGYILLKDCYVNLDNGLRNHFYESCFNEIGYEFPKTSGYMITKDEDFIVHKYCLYTKETLVEVASLDEYLDPDNPKMITKRNINLERIRFQIDTNTALHFFALDYDTLGLILDFMEDNYPGYLNAILMKNKRGKSPLDMAIDGLSPKNTELMLKKLLRFADQSLSHLFFGRFNELLKMNIKAFNLYLDSCFFQTIQMKTTKNLQFKSAEDPLLVSHNC
jgi:hypothetical protein